VPQSAEREWRERAHHCALGQPPTPLPSHPSPVCAPGSAEGVGCEPTRTLTRPSGFQDRPWLWPLVEADQGERQALRSAYTLSSREYPASQARVAASALAHKKGRTSTLRLQ